MAREDPKLAADASAIESFLAQSICYAIHLVAITPDRDDLVPNGRWFGDDAHAAAQWAEYENMRGRNVYWTVNVCREGLNKKPKGGKDGDDDMGDMVAHRFLHADVDPPEDGSLWSVEATQEKLADLRYPPSFTISSGGGVGAFWRLDEPVIDKRSVTQANRGISHLLEGDSCHNHDRLMRLPGTVNWPNKKKIGAGRQPKLATMLDADDGVAYPLQALVPVFPAPPAPPKIETCLALSGAVDLLSADDLNLDRFSPIRMAIERPGGKDRSSDGTACARIMLREGFSHEQIMGVLLNPANPVSAHYLSGDGNRSPEDKASRALEWALKLNATTDHGAQVAAGIVNNSPERPIQVLATIDPASWHGQETPTQEWALVDYIPWHQATYFTGPGSVGKSLLSQVLCTCTALGLPFLGVQTQQATSLYLSCEDDADVLHRRQKAICEQLGVPLTALSGKLHLVSLMGELGNELCAFDDRGRMSVLNRFHELDATLRDLRVRFTALDNVAHLFPEEINRNKVAAQVNLLNRLARDMDGAVLFLGHPNKEGAEFSGSTAWENQVRSRLFMGWANEADPDTRVLRRSKSNYSPRGGDLSFVWHRGSFTRLEDMPANTGAELAQTIQATADNNIFLACLAERNRQLRPVSERTCRTYAPNVFSMMPEARGLPKKRLEAAMDRLFRVNAIARGVVFRDSKKGRDCEGLIITSATPDLHP